VQFDPGEGYWKQRARDLEERVKELEILLLECKTTLMVAGKGRRLRVKIDRRLEKTNES